MTTLNSKDGTGEGYDEYRRRRFHGSACRYAGTSFQTVSVWDDMCCCWKPVRREPTKAERLQRQIDAATRLAAKAAAELERIESFPEEPSHEYDENAVVIFRKQFNPTGVIYNYAAIRCGNLWYTTGPRAPKGYTWDELMEWLDESTCDPEVALAPATGWTEL